MTTPAVSVLIVDDQAMVRVGLRAMVGHGAGLCVVGEAADGQQAVAAAFELRPDVVLMDVRMPGMTGVEATRQILSGWPHPTSPPRVLVLTTFDQDEYVHAALRAGASGFLLKNSSAEQITEGVRVVATGEAMLAPSVTRRLIGAVTALPAGLLPDASLSGVPLGPDAALLARLTRRELEVLLLVARGLTNAQIAERLELSEATVKSRVNRILIRLGLENRVQAAVVAHDAGLLEPRTRGARPATPHPDARAT